MIGVYEPIVAIEHEGERETSLAHEPSLADRPHILMVHRSCAPAAWRDRSRELSAHFSRSS